ncbi:MAG TPA: hypothetical protein DDZ91_12010 [Firmicutes bacterium]|jgi:hypothetical protein|nr:hypothetical protein [Bacillota bacterium]
MRFNKTTVAQLAMITFLGFSLIAPIAPVSADTTIALQGQIDAASIEISIDKAALNLDIPVGNTSAADQIVVSSTTVIPVQMTLEAVSHKEGSWNPTLIATDPTLLGLTDAQNQARLTIGLDTADTDYATAPAAGSIIPLGDGSTVDGGLTYPINCGVIADTDGVAEKSVNVSGTLDASKKRLLSKAFDSEMILNFAAAE